MDEPEVLAKSLPPAKRFEEYRIVKSWGLMMILTGIFATLLQVQFDIFIWVIRFLNLDPSQVSFSWMDPFVLLIFIGLPILLVIITKRVVVEHDEISSRKYVLFGLTMFLMYFTNFWLLVIIDPIITIIFFPSTVFIDSEGILNFVSSSSLKQNAIFLFTGGLSCLFSYLMMRKIVNHRRFRELLLSGVILMAFFLLITIHYNSSLVPDITEGFPHYSYPHTSPFDTFEQIIAWVTITVFTFCYVGSGFYSIRKVYLLKNCTTNNNRK